MEKSNWRVTAELIAVISVVLSLIFVGYEMRLNRAISIGQNFSSASERVFTFRQALLDNAEVWRKGCLGEAMTDTESIQFFNLVEMWNFRGFANWRNASDGIGQREPAGFARDVAINLHRFPALRNAFLVNAEMGGLERNDAWITEVERQYELLREEDFVRQVDVAHCGR